MSLRPSAIAFKLAPGENWETTIESSNIAGDAAMTVTLVGGDGAFSLTRVTAFRKIRIPYTEQELEEFPAFPPGLRDRRRREGKIELLVDGDGSPLTVNTDSTVQIGIMVRADGAKGRIAVGSVSVVRASGDALEFPLALIIGSGGVVVTPQPEKLRVLLAPGETVERSIVLDRVPVAATVVAVLDSGPAMEIARVTAFRLDHFDYTDDELGEMPEALRDEARANGYEVQAAVAQVKGAMPITVPANGRLQVDIAIRGPRDGRGNFDGFLTIVADAWARIDVPIYPVAQSLHVTPTEQRIELSQGGDRAKLALDIAAFGGAPPNIGLTIGIPGDPWSMVPNIATISLSMGGSSARVPIEIWASADAPVGEHAANLTISWLDGLGSILVPLLLIVRPGLTRVVAMPPTLTLSQARTTTTRVRVEVKSRKIIRFRPAFLPPGVTFVAPQPLQFEPGVHELDFTFLADSYAPVAVDQRVVIDWEANDGFHRGRLSFKTLILLTRTERLFSAPIVTPNGIPLGGHANFLLSNDGTGRFFGHMRATGFLSFRYQVVASVRSADGLIAIVDQVTGKVFGTDSPGPRESAWDRPTQTGLLKDYWSSAATAQMSVSRAFEFSGVVGTVFDTASALIDLLAGLAVLAPIPGGQALAVIIVAGSDLFDVTAVAPLGPGGLTGVLAAAGGAFLFGPGVIIPLFIGGAVAGIALIRHRQMTAAEQAFAVTVFGDTLPFHRILLTNLTGISGRLFTVPNSDGQILVNLGDSIFDDPLRTTTPEYPMPGQVLIHELVHAWQIAHGDLDAEFLWRGTIGKLLSGEHYGYGAAGAPFSTFGLEGQASLVDEWFSGQATNAPGRMVDGRSPENRMRADDPYFPYIAENIRLARP